MCLYTSFAHVQFGYRLFCLNVISKICPNHTNSQILKLFKKLVEVKAGIYLLWLPATSTRESTMMKEGSNSTVSYTCEHRRSRGRNLQWMVGNYDLADMHSISGVTVVIVLRPWRLEGRVECEFNPRTANKPQDDRIQL
jgi:hypothetical protein